MKDWPIIFSTPMVLALLAGHKTQTRRLAKSWMGMKAGDLAYVRESFVYAGSGDPGFLLYGATWLEDAKVWGCENIPDKCPRLTPGIHMRRTISRLTLECVADARAEPLQAISRENSIAEGATEKPKCTGFQSMQPGWSMDWHEPYQDFALGDPVMAFANFINQLHGGPRWNLKPSNLWAENPDVVALTFKVHKVNIDAFKAERLAA